MTAAEAAVERRCDIARNQRGGLLARKGQQLGMGFQFAPQQIQRFMRNAAAFGRGDTQIRFLRLSGAQAMKRKGAERAGGLIP